MHAVERRVTVYLCLKIKVNHYRIVPYCHMLRTCYSRMFPATVKGIVWLYLVFHKITTGVICKQERKGAGRNGIFEWTKKTYASICTCVT